MPFERFEWIERYFVIGYDNLGFILNMNVEKFAADW